MPVRIEKLNAMVSRIGDEHFTARVDCYVPRVLKLATVLSVDAEFQNKCASGRKDLHSVIILVHDHNSVLGIGGDSSRQIKLAVSGTLASEFQFKASVREENLNSIVPAVCNYDISFPIHAQTPRSTDLTIFVPVESECSTGTKCWLSYNVIVASWN